MLLPLYMLVHFRGEHFIYVQASNYSHPSRMFSSIKTCDTSTIAYKRPQERHANIRTQTHANIISNKSAHATHFTSTRQFLREYTHSLCVCVYACTCVCIIVCMMCLLASARAQKKSAHTHKHTHTRMDTWTDKQKPRSHERRNVRRGGVRISI